MLLHERMGGKKLFGIVMPTEFFFGRDCLMNRMMAESADVDRPRPHFFLGKPLFEPLVRMAGSWNKMMLATTGGLAA